MIVLTNNAQFVIINYCVYVRISDILYERITKGLSIKQASLITVKDENGNIFARTTILPYTFDRFKGTNITFSVEECLGSDQYVVLRPVAYKHKYEGIIRAIREYERRNSMFGIKKVIHHDPATIVYWCDGTKTVVKCGENDIYDPEKGLAMAIAKKVFGNEGNYYNEFKKWLPKEETNTSDNPADEQDEDIKKSDVITNKNPNESENTWGF